MQPALRHERDLGCQLVPYQRADLVLHLKITRYLLAGVRAAPAELF